MGLTVFALKGGLLRTSPRLEYFWGALGVNPKAALASLLTQKKPEDVSLRVDLLPLNEDVLSQIEALKSADKAVALSTRDYPELATALAAQLGIALSEAKGETRPQSWNVRALLKAIRPHQWVKNILLLMPLLAAHRFDSGSLLLALLGIVAFSAAASSIYVVNDLVDLEADRLHPKKCERPFASGTVPLTVGMLTGLVLVSVALGVGAYLGPKFLAITLLYVFVSVAYSMRLKRMRWVDIILLASLYSVRVVAGAAAAGVAVSGAMLFFIFPVFLTLGAVKRLTELTLATNDERLPGRGYGRPDRGKLLNFAVVSMISALLIFFIYSQSAQAMALYPDRWFLWLAILPLAAWLFRMVRLGYYGKQDYDPIVFALSDKRGIGLILITLSLMFYAAGLWAQWFGF
ncbi:4-hydroxybenzoate polyprenyltransferase [Lentibacter algarum]|uniref:4-hydroxybenzoate polyprenyltransferase n=1 Tax=Lentibacter algarum TaxID=576131 RepID=A0A1H3H9E3_9RHOB|nr:UbiA family prenyltransferase [Lentibacter algarum]SDY12193.1 4-hydroxybenzoate polyprenyltransferase [Lentibacter algarum]